MAFTSVATSSLSSTVSNCSPTTSTTPQSTLPPTIASVSHFSNPRVMEESPSSHPGNGADRASQCLSEGGHDATMGERISQDKPLAASSLCVSPSTVPASSNSSSSCMQQDLAPTSSPATSKSSAPSTVSNSDDLSCPSTPASPTILKLELLSSPSLPAASIRNTDVSNKSILALPPVDVLLPQPGSDEPRGSISIASTSSGVSLVSDSTQQQQSNHLSSSLTHRSIRN